jgi:ribosomal protein S6
MRIYEELFIVKPNAPEEEVNPLIESLTGVITQSRGSWPTRLAGTRKATTF